MHALKIGEKDSDRNKNYMSIIGENDSNPLLSERPIDDTVLMLNLLPDKLFEVGFFSSQICYYSFNGRV